MLLIWFGLSLAIDPVTEIKLENFNRFLPDASYNRVFLGKNDTYIALTNYQVWHWDAEGKVINQFGAKGEGPGEFVWAGQVHWDGDYYWVIDSKSLSSSVFDNHGKYMDRQPIYFRQFVPVGDELFILDFSKVNQFDGNYPQTLQKIEYRIDGRGLSVEMTPLKFKKVSQRQKDFHYNFKLVWVVREGQDYLVVDQLEPKIWVYSPETIGRESKTPDNRPFEAPFVNVQARLWVDPPKFVPGNLKNDKDFLYWWQSWSRVNYFANAGEDFIFAYERPDEKDPAESLQVIQRIGRDGRAKGEPLILSGVIMGVRKNQVYIFKEEDTEDGYSYYVRAYDF